MSSIELKKDSEYIVTTQSIISSYDRKILTRLYQPLIGCNAFALYLTLQSELEFDKTVSSIKNSVNCICKLMAISINDFILAKSKLEGVGLIKTLFDRKNNNFVFNLYSPLSPGDFFQNPLLDSLSLKALGQNEYDRNKQYFTFASFDQSDLEDVSSEFNDSFIKENVDKKVNSSRQINKKTSSIKVSFDFDTFYQKLLSFQVSKSSITPDVLNRIPYFACAYNISSVDMADIIVRSQIKTGKTNIKDVRELCVKHAKENSDLVINKSNIKTGNTLLNQIIAAYGDNEPIEFLFIKYNVPVSKLEEDFIYNMMFSYKIASPIMNAILDYCYEKCGGVLVKNYLETVCANIARKAPKNSFDTYNMLRSSSSKSIVKETTKEDESDIDLQKTLDNIAKRKKELGNEDI